MLTKDQIKTAKEIIAAVEVARDMGSSYENIDNAADDAVSFLETLIAEDEQPCKGCESDECTVCQNDDVVCCANDNEIDADIQKEFCVDCECYTCDAYGSENCTESCIQYKPLMPCYAAIEQNERDYADKIEAINDINIDPSLFPC